MLQNHVPTPFLLACSQFLLVLAEAPQYCNDLAMTLPRLRHAHHPRSSSTTSSRRSSSSYSSHLLSGKHLRRRGGVRGTGSGICSSATCCCCCTPVLSTTLLDLLLQTGLLCLLSAVAITIVLIVGKSLSLLQSYLHPDVTPQLDTVAIPQRPLRSFLSSTTTNNMLRSFSTSQQQLQQQTAFSTTNAEVWGMHLHVSPLLSSSQEGFRRRIDPEDHELYEQHRASVLRWLPNRGSQQQQPSPSTVLEEEEVDERYVPSDQLDQPRTCQRTSWHSKFYPVCNSFHELTLDRINLDRYYDHRFQQQQLLRDGPVAFPEGPVTPVSERWEWVLTPQFLGLLGDDDVSLLLEQVSLRSYGVGHDHSARTFRQRQVQAIVSERFTSSPRIVSSFGYCGLDLFLERSRSSASTSSSLLQRNRPYSGQEALNLAIAMAEAIADLHGFLGGVIVHGHLDLSLFHHATRNPPSSISSSSSSSSSSLSSSPQQVASTIQLTDASTADFLEWDANQQAYCPAATDTRSVEMDPVLEADFLEEPVVNEQTDLYAFADMFFTLLTGRDVSRSTLGIPNIDETIRERGVLEGRLADVLIKTWTDDLPSIFAVLKELREIKREA